MNGVLRNPVLPQICRPIPFLVKTGHTNHRHSTCVCVHISNPKSRRLLMLTRPSMEGNRKNGEKWNMLLPPAIRTFRTCFPPVFVDQNLSCFNSQIIWKKHIPEPFTRILSRVWLHCVASIYSNT